MLCLSPLGFGNKYHRLGGINNRNSFLTTLEAGMSEIEAPADSVLGDGPFPSSYMSIFLLCHHMVKKGPLWESLFYETGPLFHEGSILMTYSPPRGPPPIWGLGFPHMNLEGTQTFSPLCLIILNMFILKISFI